MFFYKFIGIDDSFPDQHDNVEILWSYEQYTTDKLESFVNQIIEDIKPKLIAETQSKVNGWAKNEIIFPLAKRDTFRLGIFFMDFWEPVIEALVSDYGFRRLQFENEYSRRLKDLIDQVGITNTPGSSNF